jgi:hypothetical protein
MPARPVLHPRFHRVASQASSFSSDGRYVVVSSRSRTSLIDGRTGGRMPLTPPAMCGYGYIVGGGRVLTSCVGYGNPPYQLYSIATGAWSAVRSSGGMPVALGRDWIEYYGPTDPECSEHCTYQHSFGDIATDNLRTLPRWAPGARTIPDLSSPALTAKLCSPLRVPQGFPTEATRPALAPQPLSFAGRFVSGLEWYVHGGLYQLRLLLERCGSRLHRVLARNLTSSPASQFAMNRDAVVWLDYRGGPIHGLFLPSLRKFTIAVPPAAGLTDFGRSIYLASRELYLMDGSGQVIAAPAPRRSLHAQDLVTVAHRG